MEFSMLNDGNDGSEESIDFNRYILKCCYFAETFTYHYEI